MQTFVMESDGTLEVQYHYFRVPRKTSPVAKKPPPVGVIKSAIDTPLVSIYHHTDGHTYLQDHVGNLVLKSIRPIHHPATDIRASYALATKTDPTNYYVD